MHFSLHVTMLLVTSFLARCPLSAQEGFYGTICDDTSKPPMTCDKGHWLECKPSPAYKVSTCQCQEGMVAGTEGEPCLSKIGSECQTEVKLYGIKNCVKFGYCANGVCRCELGFEPSTSNQTCLITYGSNLTCSGIHDCNYNRGLQCIHQAQGAQNGGICTCDPFKEIWDTRIRTCLKKIKSPCSKTAECVENGECLKGLCSCSGDFETTPSRECKKNYGRPCTIHGLESDCHPDFHCLPFGPDNKLTCTCLPGVEIHHENHCDRMAGQPCIPDVTPCVDNSVCRAGKCTCADGFQPGESGQCVRGYGGDCAWSPTNACNGQAKLFCEKDTSRCECLPGHEWDPKMMTCRGLPGAPCTAMAKDCYALAECDPKAGKCACVAGYTNNTQDGRCQLTHDQACSILSPCNALDFLRCDVTTQRCVCDGPGMLWDGRSCQATVGSLCFLKPIDGRQLRCGKNGQCVRRSAGGGSPGHGICECGTGYQASELGVCDQKQNGAGIRVGVSSLNFIILIIFHFINNSPTRDCL